MDNLWRQRFAADYQRQKWPVMAWANTYQGGERQIWHSHEQGQLVAPTQGVVRVLTSVGAWAVTPLHALWIAPGVDHELHMVGSVTLSTLRVEPDAAPWLWRECSLIVVTPLLRELLLSMARDPFEYEAHNDAALMAPLALRCLETAQPVEHGRLPLPRDKRLLQVCELLIQSPGSENTLEQISAQVGASTRTMTRLFKQETGLTFGQWRQQAMLSEAVCQLSLGSTVSRVARHLGYTNANAFSAMFRRVLGVPPLRYMRGAT
ncbi:MULTISPECIES: helix-turn-helix transcriptional regulator [unclassified Dyella]|uniref:AraC family transcriptional regulator n=1 Tax=unclassified Dyella TaxID=2634549 RepID=UPI000C81B1C3|nr:MULTISPECIES: helix-turn-helix transcriptional regulator [unclassified Dyella]MDR3447953.1 helix-turn-helix transcriptional regulator [Dyella sp.]PMQ03357.1 HTH-type transcriptional repressor of iron proteins A [Dyella sp. AD56]